MTPEDLERERKALIAEIHSAFRGTSRRGGVSWGQSFVLDVGREHAKEALANDTDREWAELIDDPRWQSHPGVGGFSFLDSIGLRYYFPVAMMRAILGPDLLPNLRKASIHDDALDTLQFQLERRFFEFNDVQQRCLERFVRFKIAEGEYLLESQPSWYVSHTCDRWKAIHDALWNQKGSP